jgi:origin recognition complex subunit 1
VRAQALHARLHSHFVLMAGDAARLPLNRLAEAAAALGAARLLTAEAAWRGPGARMALAVPRDDVLGVLRDDPALEPLRSLLL